MEAYQGALREAGSQSGTSKSPDFVSAAPICHFDEAVAERCARIREAVRGGRVRRQSARARPDDRPQLPFENRLTLVTRNRRRLRRHPRTSCSTASSVAGTCCLPTRILIVTMSTNPPELDSRPQSRREWSGYLRSLVLPLGLLAVIIGGLFWYQARARLGRSVRRLRHASRCPQTRTPRPSRPTPPWAGRRLTSCSKRRTAPTLRLSDLQGQPVVVNFWATWCTTCRSEMPDLIKTYEAAEANGLQVVGVNLRESDGPCRDLRRRASAPRYPLVIDRSARSRAPGASAGRTRALPSSYFIDSSGVVRKVIFGLLTPKNIGEGLDSIKAPPPRQEPSAARADRGRRPLAGHRPAARALASAHLGPLCPDADRLPGLGGAARRAYTPVPPEMRGNPAADSSLAQPARRQVRLPDRPDVPAGPVRLFRSVWFIAGARDAGGQRLRLHRQPPAARLAQRLPSPDARPGRVLRAASSPVIAVPARRCQSPRRRQLRAPALPRSRTTSDGGTTYLFADRYPWAQLATFVSHLALILFLAGGFVTVITAQGRAGLRRRGRRCRCAGLRAQRPRPHAGLRAERHRPLHARRHAVRLPHRPDRVQGRQAGGAGRRRPSTAPSPTAAIASTRAPTSRTAPR